MTTQYSNVLANGFSKTTITFKMEKIVDDLQEAPDENDEGFWPSLNKDDAGYVGEKPVVSFSEQMQAATERMAAWRRRDWGYICVRAKALIAIPVGQCGICTYELESAGVWGIESDSEESHLQEIYDEQKVELLGHIKQLHNAEVK